MLLEWGVVTRWNQIDGNWLVVMDSEDTAETDIGDKTKCPLHEDQDPEIASPCQWIDSIPRLFLRFAHCICDFLCSSHSSMT